VKKKHPVDGSLNINKTPKETLIKEDQRRVRKDYQQFSFISVGLSDVARKMEIREGG